jgi:hypothetical protein
MLRLSHLPRLTPVVFALLILVPASAFAWIGPPQAPTIGVSRLLHPDSYLDADFAGLVGSQPYTVSTLKGNFVLFEDEVDTWQSNVTLQDFHFEEQLPLSIEDGSMGTVPTNLRTVNIGATYSHKLDKKGKSWGINTTVGSESDKLFNSFHEMDISVTGTYSYPTDPLHGWVFFLNEATNRAFAPGIPIPGAGWYSVSPANHTTVFVGIPFFFGWQPTSDWNIFASYFIPTTVHVGAEYKLSSTWKTHTDFQILPQAWTRAGRPDTSTRLIFNSAQATTGLKAAISTPFYFDIYGGYAFDQQIFEAHSILSSGVTKTNLASGFFVNAEVAYHL